MTSFTREREVLSEVVLIRVSLICSGKDISGLYVTHKVGDHGD